MLEGEVAELIFGERVERGRVTSFPCNAEHRRIDGSDNPIAHTHGNAGVRSIREYNLLADANISEGGMEIVNVTHSFEMHLMAVRCISIIARARK